MSTTYSIACTSCQQRLWVGQGSVNPYLYNGPEYHCATEAFLIVHRGHLLIFGSDDETELAMPDFPRPFVSSDIPAPLFTRLCADHNVTPAALRDVLEY